jgi:O-antigen/teichoic acid export membrane protein
VAAPIQWPLGERPVNGDLSGIASYPETVQTTSPPGSVHDRISAKGLARSTMWNFSGVVFPSIVAVISIPFLTRGLGTDQFGVLTLASVVIGNLNIFDLGLGRALTKLVAEHFGSEKDNTIPPLFWASFLLTLVLGVMAGVGLAALSPWLVYRVLKIPLAIRAETLTTFYLLAFAMPAIVSTIGLRGFVEGCHRFDLLNAVRIPVNLSSYVGPLLVLPFSHRLLPVMIVLVVSRWLGWAAHLWICFRAFPALYLRRSPKGAPLRAMFGFGGWMTVTNLIAPSLVVLDRFVIGAMLSIAAVTYYATPFEAVTRLLIVPGAVVGVLFPAFSASLVQTPQRTAVLFERGLKYIILFLFPAVLLCVGFSREGLGLWLGPAFVENSTRVLQLLSIGVFFNGVAYVPSAQVQGAGRPDLTAKFLLLELPLYLFALWTLLHRYGIAGAAAAWLLRAGFDSCLLLWATGRILPASRGAVRRLSLVILGAACLLGVIVFMPSLWLRLAYVSALATLSGWLAWTHLLSPHERSLVNGWLRLRPQAV